MAKRNQVTVPGSSLTLRIHPEVKAYTLRDNGFMVTPNGNFQYERPLVQSTAPSVPVLKMTVTKNFDRLRFSIVMGKTAKRVNLYTDPKFEKEREMLEFVIQQLIDEKVLEKVE